MSQTFSLAKLARILKAVNLGKSIILDGNGYPTAFDPKYDDNLIINGNMLVAQRNTTYALTTSTAYGSIDRWCFQQATSAAGVADQVAANLAGFQYALKLGRNSGATSTGIIQANNVLESVSSIPLQSKTVTISFWAKAGANFSGTQLNTALISGQGIDQTSVSLGTWTSQSTVASLNQTLTTIWTRYSYTGTVSTSATQLAVHFEYTPTGTAGADDNVYITGVKLNEGSIATPINFRSFGTELSLCQRYYSKSNPIYTLGSVYSAGYEVLPSTIFPVTMRNIPAYTPTVGAKSSGGTPGTTGAYNAQVGENSARNDFVNTGGVVNTTYTVTLSWTADAEL